jgi:hypothetical protein
VTEADIERVKVGIRELFREDAATRRRLQEQGIREDIERKVQASGTRGLSLASKVTWHHMQLEAWGPELGFLKWHVEYLCRRHDVGIRWTADLAIAAWAIPDERVIEIGPIRTEFGYASALHELGHLVRPCVPSHNRTKGLGCPRCEIRAWEFAADVAHPHWTREMHTALSHSLPTYSWVASPQEQREIQTMATTRWRLERLLKEMQR